MLIGFGSLSLAVFLFASIAFTFFFTSVEGFRRSGTTPARPGRRLSRCFLSAVDWRSSESPQSARTNSRDVLKNSCPTRWRLTLNKPGRKNFQACLAPPATQQARKRATRRRFIPARTGIISRRLLSPAASQTAFRAPSLLRPPLQDQAMEVQEAAPAAVVVAEVAAAGELAQDRDL